MRIDDESDYYMEDDEDKWVIMPTENLFDDDSEDEEESDNEEEKGASYGSADTRERRAVADEFRRTGKGQGYDKLETPAQVAAYRSSYGLGPAKPSGGSNPRPRPAPMPNQTMPVNPRRRPAPMPNIPGRRTNDRGFMKSAEQPLRDPKGGLTAAGRKYFKETEGANLKPGVKGAADTPTKMRRKGSFLVRFFTNPRGPMVDEQGRPTRLALSARAWGEPVPQNREDAAELAAKGRRLLDRYRSQQEKSKGQKSFEQFQLSLKELGTPVGGTSGTVGQQTSRRSSGGADKFNPTARDADGDGNVQEGTDFMRPTDTKPKKWMTDRGSADTRERGAIRQNLTEMGFDGEAFRKLMDAESRKLKPGEKTNWNPGRLPNGGKIAADGTYIPPDMVREDDKRMSDYYRKRREARAKASGPKITREGDVVPNKNRDRRTNTTGRRNQNTSSTRNQNPKPLNNAKPWNNAKPFNQGKPSSFIGKPSKPWDDEDSQND